MSSGRVCEWGAWAALGSLLATLAGAACTSFGAESEPTSSDGGSGTTDGAALADALVDEAGGCGADLDTDSKNCGACNHDCLGGACAGGLCMQKDLLVPSSATPEMTVGASRIVWTDFQKVFSCAAPGCSATSFEMPSGPKLVAVTPSALYWSNAANVGYFVFGGGNGSTGATGIEGIAVRGDLLLYAESDKIKVYSAGLSGDVASLLGVKWKLVAASGAAVYASDDKSRIYAFDWDGLSVGNPATPTAITSNGAINSIVALATVGSLPGTVFWASQDGIGKTLRTAMNAQVIVPSVKPVRIALDADHLYATQSDGRVMRYDHDGQHPLRLAAADVPVSIAVDDSWVYYVDKSGIWRVAK